MPAVKARSLFNRRISLGDKLFAELAILQIPTPLPGSVHPYKYRLALVSDERCVLRYDNESGQGDHRHIGEMEQPYVFSDVDRLVADFFNDVTRWRNECGDT